MNTFKLILSALTLSVLITIMGCGGGGGGGASGGDTGPVYSGLTTPAAIDVTNAETVATASTEAAAEAITQDTAMDANPFGISMTSGNSNLNALLAEVARSVANSSQAINLPVAIQTYSYVDLGGYPFCGGSVTLDDTFINSVQVNGTMNGSITFNSLCYSDPAIGQMLMNGTLSFTETLTEITIRYINFRIAIGSDSQTINMTISCDTSLFSCSITADFAGSDGKIYRVANMTVTGSGTGPYYVDATFYHPDYGSFSMTATGIIYGCSNGHPNAGTITFSGANGSTGSITFRNDCTGYDGTWDDGSISSGVFNGNWL